MMLGRFVIEYESEWYQLSTKRVKKNNFCIKVVKKFPSTVHMQYAYRSIIELNYSSHQLENDLQT